MKKNSNGSRVPVWKDCFSAMIARSCERLKLSENIQDEELSVFYRDLMESEAGHYTNFYYLCPKIRNRN
jgi:tRNA-(ms[2]io[6]A)-hydroxylase